MRFPEFSGEWLISLLSDFLIENKERNKEGKFDKNDVLSVSGDYGIINQIELLGRSFAGASVLPYHIVKHGNIVYTKSPLKEYPYGIVKANTGIDGIVSTLYAVYYVKDNADARFVEYYFSLANRTNRYFKPIVRIGAKHDMKISNQEVLANNVIFPNLEEQKKIGNFLNLITERIETQKKIIDKYESLIKGLTDKLINSSLRFPIRNFASLYTKAAEGGTPSTSNINFYLNGKIPFIKIEDLNNKYLMTHKDNITELGLKKSSTWIIPTGSLIYSNGATIGAISISTYPVCTKQGILGIIPNKSIDIEYFYYLMISKYFRKEITKIITEGTMKIAYLKDINKILCPVPNINEQKKIVKTLSSISQKIKLEQDIISKLHFQKKYLLYQMFI